MKDLNKQLNKLFAKSQDALLETIDSVEGEGYDSVIFYWAFPDLSADAVVWHDGTCVAITYRNNSRQ
jgi:hypothetical protein